MIISQLNNIRYDMTYIETLSEDKKEPVRFYDSLVETMGEKYNYRWYFPIKGKELDITYKRIISLKTD